MLSVGITYTVMGGISICNKIKNLKRSELNSQRRSDASFIYLFRATRPIVKKKQEKTDRTQKHTQKHITHIIFVLCPI